MKNQKTKTLKFYFCPRCKSKEVGYIFNFRNLFGIFPRMKCKRCCFEAMVFPIMVVSADALNKHKRNKIRRGK